MNQITPHSDFLQLEKKYGAIIGGMQLARLLGYQSTAALRQADFRGKLPIQTFLIPHRRGRFAYTHEITQWLQKLTVEQGDRPHLLLSQEEE